MNDARETFLVGDPHGCLVELQELLDTIKFDPKKIRLIICGDLIDRGIAGAEVVQFVRALCEAGNAECVLGNHDEKQIRYRAHTIKCAETGKKHPMRRMSDNDLEAHNKLTDDDIAWISRLPLTIHIKDNWYALHGGLEPAYPFNRQSKEQIIRCRYVSDGKHVTSSGKEIAWGKALSMGKDFAQPPNSMYWAEGWIGPEQIIFGHFVSDFEKPYVMEHKNGTKCIGIDTGCVFGGRLSGYFLERNEFVQVKAKREYYKMTKGEE